jgi:ribosomal protein S27AE
MELAGLFTSAAGAVRLLGTRCPACGTVAFPSRAVCGSCGCRTLEPAELSGEGRVHAFTTVRTPPAGFDAPYLAAVVDLDEGPRVFAMLTAEPREALSGSAPSGSAPSGSAPSGPAQAPGATGGTPGARVRAVPARVRDGRPGFAFEPVP